MLLGVDLGTWLFGVLADTSRRRLVTSAFGTDQEQALQKVATDAIRRTAQEFRPGDDVQAGQLAMVVDQVFQAPVPDEPLAERATVLEAVQAEVMRQLAVLDDASLTGVGS